MKTDKEMIDVRNVPSGYIRCFNEQCALHAECLRWQVGRHTDPCLTTAQTVLPTVLDMEACPHYQEAVQQRMAWGFNTLFAEVKRKDERPLRNAMTEYLGGVGTYSRYKLGRRLLTPEQQRHIMALFQQRGYADGLGFDHYMTVYDFDH